ncbi:MAG: DUF1987 domain-containing protein [Bacteroidetes bacterium]|nr:DUF1987 domain-containing protein [Bacteroidota bacterium]
MEELKSLIIEGTKKTPLIEFNNLTGELVLSGKSYPENTARVYEPVVEWISDYIKTYHKTTNFHLRLDYFNSTSLLWIVKILKMLSTYDKKESNLFINLYFDDEDFDLKDKEEFKDIIFSVFENVTNPKLTISVKIHGIDCNGNVVQESTIVI